jgi:predicted amidohydrolase
MLQRLGIFHFCGRDRSDPVGSLRASLIEASKDGDISGSLVVAPEAFNLRNGYWSDDRQLDASIGTALGELSAELKIAFVVGLIGDRDAQGPGYSCAHLIDGHAIHLLTCKMADDGSGNYRCCTEECDRPTEYRGVRVAALVCLDAADFGENDRRRAAVLERMCLQGTMRGILCVPAHMMSYGSREVALGWPAGIAVAVANSSGKQPSVLRFGADVSCIKGNENVVVFAALP